MRFNSETLLPVLIIVVLVFVISGCGAPAKPDQTEEQQIEDDKEDTLAKTESHEYGNISGSHANLAARVAGQGNYVYYVNSLGTDTAAIYRMRHDGSDKECLAELGSLSSNQYWSFNVLEDWIYYVNHDDNQVIYRMRTDGNEREPLNNDRSLFVSVVDGWIYYVNQDDYWIIYRMRTDGSEQEPLNNDKSWGVNVVDGWIYYSNKEANSHIYRMRTDGSDRTPLNNHSSSVANVVGEWIYYTSADQGVYRVRTDGSGRERLNDHWSTSVNVVDDWIYYVNMRRGKSIHRMRTDGSEDRRVNDQPFGSIWVVDEWIYYINEEDDNLLYRMRTDGSNVEPVGRIATEKGTTAAGEPEPEQKPEDSFVPEWGDRGEAEGEFSFPMGVAVGSDGTIYVHDSGNQRIQAFESNGTFLREWSLQDYGVAQGRALRNAPSKDVAVAPDGTVYVASTASSRILAFTSEGVFLHSWAAGSPHGYLGMAVAPDGTIYVADSENYRIQVFGHDGTFIREWETTTIGGIMGMTTERNAPPGSIAVAPDGTVYVVFGFARLGSGHFVQAYEGDGTLIAEFGPKENPQGSGEGQFEYPSGIDVAPDGTVYVVDRGNDRVQKFTSDGTFIAEWGSSGSGEGEFNAPHSIAVAPDGTVYVTDLLNHRIQAFR